MNITFGDYGINIQLVPLFGLSLGVNYWNPRLTDETIEDEDFYHELQFLLLFFAIRFEVWKF